MWVNILIFTLTHKNTLIYFVFVFCKYKGILHPETKYSKLTYFYDKKIAKR